MTVREIQEFLAEMYDVEVSPDLISTVTDGIVAQVTAWQGRRRTNHQPPTTNYQPPTTNYSYSAAS